MPVKPVSQNNYDTARRFFVDRLHMPVWVAYAGNGEPKQPRTVNGVLIDMADPRNQEMAGIAQRLKKQRDDLFQYQRPGGGSVTSQAVGEEDGGSVTSQAIGEEDGGSVTSQAIGEEDGGGRVTSQAIGEEDGFTRPARGRRAEQVVTSQAVGEEDSFTSAR
jgi:hypothetical protein